MRHPILAALLLAALGSSAHAAWLDVTPHAGYSTVSMGQLNRANAAMFGWYPNDNERPIDSALVAGLDLTTDRLSAWKQLHLGLRSDYLQTNLGEVKSLDNSNGFTSNSGIDYTDQGKMVDALLGGEIQVPYLSPGLKIGLGAWLGAAYGTLSQSVYDKSNVLISGNYTSIFLTGQLEALLRYRLTKHLAIAFNGGWRWADAGIVKDSRGTPLYDSLDYWENGLKHPVDVDFSGATAQGSLNVSF